MGVELDSEVLADWTVPRHLDQVPGLRRQIRELANAVLGEPDRAHDVAVCASETIGNAVLHGGGTHIRILVYADTEGLTVEVCDDGTTGMPYVRPDTGGESGRGLLIVAQLADRWGTTIDPDTGRRCVSFDFDTRPAAHPEARP